MKKAVADDTPREALRPWVGLQHSCVDGGVSASHGRGKAARYSVQASHFWKSDFTKGVRRVRLN